jgi:hypothetical protein
VSYEMQWTVQYFLHNKDVWDTRRKGILPGPASYAACKAAMWHVVALNADKIFANTNTLYKCLLA